MSISFSWVPFYSEFAEKLIPYKNNRIELVKIINEVFEEVEIKLPKLDNPGMFNDIDPFTTFGLFNKSITEENRTKIAGVFSRRFGMHAVVPDDYEGIPTLNNQNATFYWFTGHRGEEDIDDLWNLFTSALSYSKNPSIENKESVSKYFDLCVNKKGNGNAKISMGLFWIAPSTFLNLDTNNEQYIYKSGKIPKDIVDNIPKIEAKISAKKYFEIVDGLNKYISSGEASFKDFKEFSSEAWNYAKEINEQKKIEKKNGVSGADFLKWYGPIIQALKDLGGSATPEETRTKIIENENLSEEEITETRGKSNVNKFKNQVAWARNYLVSAGYINGEERGIWKLTEAGYEVEMTPELATEIFKNGLASNKNSTGEDSMGDAGIETVRYWMYAPGEQASKWDEFYSNGIMAIGWGEIGDFSQYSSKAEMKEAMRESIDGSLSFMNAAHATWDFYNRIKPGDIVYAKKGRSIVVGRGVVTSEYIYDESQGEYCNIRKVDWTHKGEWSHPGKAVTKTLTEITQYSDYVKKLKALFESENDDDGEDIAIDYPVYTKEQFLDEVYISNEDYETMISVLFNKKNIILQGAPGVGKTFAAKRLAYSIMGVKDQERVMMVQFHQSYSYEDFIMGYRPTEDGFELKEGAFYSFCKKAEIDSDNEYFFIIDEINRGNLSKIFGELFMLIENDKRGVELQLLYKEERFSIPKNVYIIGMMNTADRGLAMLDYALRRRFAFIDMRPGFETDGFREYRMSLDSAKFDKLIECVQRLNSVISEDESLGEGFCIGHSYFCNINKEDLDDNALSNIVEFELAPLLKEYWFDEPSRARDWTENLRSSVK